MRRSPRDARGFSPRARVCALLLLACPALARAAAEAEPDKGEPLRITVTSPRIEPLGSKAATARGRIYGDLKGCPGAVVELLDADGKLLRSTKAYQGALIYELRSLSPGTYHLRVRADDGGEATMPGVPVQGRADTRVDIAFGDAPKPDPDATKADAPGQRSWKPDPKPGKGQQADKAKGRRKQGKKKRKKGGGKKPGKQDGKKKGKGKANKPKKGN